MKKILVLVLLISVGLNIGLGVRLWKTGQRQTLADRSGRYSAEFRSDGRRGSGGGRDGAFWQGVMERRLAMVTEVLQLNAEQAEAFRLAHRLTAEEFLGQRTRVQEARHRLMEAAFGPDFGGDALRPLIAEVGRQQARLDSLVTETMLREMEILDEEQRREYLRILPINRFGGRGGRPDGGMGHRRR